MINEYITRVVHTCHHCGKHISKGGKEFFNEWWPKKFFCNRKICQREWVDAVNREFDVNNK